MLSENVIRRNRRIVGTLLAMQRSEPAETAEMDFHRFFSVHVDDFLRNKPATMFALTLTAKLVGECAKEDLGFANGTLVILSKVPGVRDDDPLRMAYRLTVAAMNDDADMVQAMVEVAAEDQDRASDVLASLMGMLCSASPLRGT